MKVIERLIVAQNDLVDIRNLICLEKRVGDPQLMNIMEAECALGRVIKQREAGQ